MLNDPSLDFMKDFVEGFGGKVPAAPAGHGHGHGHDAPAQDSHGHGHAHGADGSCPGGHGHDAPAGGHGHGHGSPAGVPKYLDTKAEWDKCHADATAEGKAVLVDFTATWCGPCKQIGPVFNTLAAMNPGAVFVKVDVDKNTQVAEMCGIKSMPTFQVFKGGAKVDEMSGANDAGLKALVAKYAEPEEEAESESEESEEEADEVDDKVVAADEDPGEQSTAEVEWTEENDEKAATAKQAAMDAMGDGEFAKAAEAYTTALALMPSPLTFAKRAECYLKLAKPMAAIRDCDAALKINPDSAKGYKVRGKAYRLLGDYEKALKDLGQGQNADWDDATEEVLNDVKPRAAKILQKKLKGTRKVEEKAKKERMKRVAKAKKEYEAQKRMDEAEKAAEAAHGHGHAHSGGGGGGGGGGMPPGMDGFPGNPGNPGGGGMGGMPPGMDALFQDPEIMALLSQPGVGEALQDMMSNPGAGMAKYANNPTVMAAFQKIQEKMMGGGMPPGGMPDMGGGPSGVPSSFADDID